MEQLCRERRNAENDVQPPALIDENEVNDNELAIEVDVEEQADNEQQRANVPMREVIDEHHIDGHQNNLLIGEVDSKGKEEVSDNEEGGENQLTPQELLINYARGHCCLWFLSSA
jgi:hypothetical protein